MDEIEIQLRKRSFNITREDENLIKVNLGFGLISKITTSNNSYLNVSGYLKPWNFATGMIPMSMKWFMIYNLIGLLLVFGLLMYLGGSTQPRPFYYDFFFVWIMLSNFYYTIKYYWFKMLIHFLFI